ncbi:glutamyl-tRNA reductase [Catenovulum sp. SM1970]|uniref:glutamyl-tRNA reductase n=1 Tax=Marinifaba aquimaris TaxID=2741323 RepID=UPI0015730CF1|nr:glutamyl-tRNA reductase [Marinifaba aquimaris]NTS75989.1 glutamyl-tRNA reductase [Marinifaba aquimaris]
MALFSFGVSHKTAPVSIREKVVFSSDLLDEAVESIRARCDIDEVVVVSTCNRTEVYLFGSSFGSSHALDWLADFFSLNAAELKPVIYFKQEADAVEHIMSVACGLDSLVLGEPQILGQLKQAFSQAKTRGHALTMMERLFQHVFTVAKDVRTHTEIGSSAVSVAFAAVNLAKHIFADLKQSNVLLVGAGETIELVARHLTEAGCENLTVANRTLVRAQELASEFGANTATLNEIPKLLAQTDVVVSSTASTLPIIGKGMVEQALKQRLNQPMLMVDIAVPRDIEEQVNEVDNVYLYTVDDLMGIVEKNQKQREQAAKQALVYIEREQARYFAWLESLKSVDYVRSYRQTCEQVKDESLQRALKQIEQGIEAEQVLLELANRLTNKLMHAPTKMIREAATADDAETINLIADQFGLVKK